MKKLLILTSIALFFSVSAQAKIKPCDELRSEIHTKITKNGVPEFELIVVKSEDVNDYEDWKVVGSCESGSNKILYKK
jgi:hypothetical protein